MARPKRPLPPEIGKMSDRLVALAEAKRGHHTTTAAIKQLRYRNGIGPGAAKGWPKSERNDDR